MDAATFLSTDEKREALGFGAMKSGEALAPAGKRVAPPERRYSPDQLRDDLGRWTSGSDDLAEPASILAAVADSFGELVANYMAGGQRICVYKFDFGLVSTVGSNNLGCLSPMHSSGVWHGQMLNDN